MYSRTIIISFFLLFSAVSFSYSKQECTKEGDTYGRVQTINANLLNYISDPAKMREVTDFFGAQSQAANAYIKEGKYQEACDAYQEVIDKYDMKTIEEQYYEKYPEKRPDNQQKAKNAEPAASSNTEAAASSQDAAGSAAGAVSDESAPE